MIPSNFLFNDLHFEILEKCNYSYAQKINKQIDCTWKTCYDIIKLLEFYKLIKKTRQGRIDLLDLTEKGKIVIKFYQETLKPLREIKEENGK